MNKTVSFSKQESELLCLKIGRFSGRMPDPVWLKSEIKQGTYDICKLALQADDPELYIKLDQLGWPYYVLGMVQDYRINLKRYQYKELYHPNARMVPYTPENKDALWDLAYTSFYEVPGSYFINPALEGYTDSDKEARLLADYVCTFRPDLHDERYCHLLEYKGEFVGFVTHSVDGKNARSNYAGVLRSRNTPGFYIDLVRFIQNHGKELGKHWGFTSAQIQNTVVHKTYMREGTMPVGSTVNVHINSFLNTKPK